jgi:FkbM family methyltransferase
MLSYSQNLEDVLLDRCFRNQKSGIYVDVGAGPGDGYSVTKNLYLQGWSGLLIEPVPAYAEFHREARPRDTVVAVAVGSEDCEIKFVHFMDTGLSSKKLYLSEAISDSYPHETLIIPQLKLQSILNEQSVNHIDLLKIDVEGSEMEVLLGLDFNKIQPRLIVIEATRPMSRIRVSDEIREYLSGIGYEFAFFDGLNDLNLR